MHQHDKAPVIVFIINIYRVAFNDGEGHTPITAYFYRPRSFSASRQRMEHEPWKAHILGHSGYVQATEDKLKSFSVLRLDACLGAFKK